jgi:hypothetical protein
MKKSFDVLILRCERSLPKGALVFQSFRKPPSRVFDFYRYHWRPMIITAIAIAAGSYAIYSSGRSRSMSRLEFSHAGRYIFKDIRNSAY